MAEIIFVSTRRPRNGAGLCVLHSTILSCNNPSRTPVDRPDYSETGPFMSHEATGHQSLIKPASAWPANFKDLSSVSFSAMEPRELMWPLSMRREIRRA